MTVNDQLKIIDNKFKENQAQHDLDKLAAKISACFSGDLRKYEYPTGEDFGYKPSLFKQAKFDCSPLVIFVIRDWIKMTKKKGFLRD